MVVIEKRHRLRTTADNLCFNVVFSLNEIWPGIACDGTVCRDTPSIYPLVKYPVGFVVVVALKIVQEKEISYSKAPDSAFTDCPVGIELVDTPIVASGEFESLWRSIASSALAASIYASRVGRIGVGYTLFIGAEVHIVLNYLISRCPAKRRCYSNVRRRPISRARIPCE